MFSVLAVLAVLAVIAVPSALADIPPSKTYPANAVWFDPEDSSAKYCETVDVDVWINTTIPSAGFCGVFDYTFCCANVTDFVGNTENWNLFCEANLMPPGHVIITAVTMDENPPDIPVHIGTLTIHCCDETSPCLTDLVWDTGESYIEDPEDFEIEDVNWVDGTFSCEAELIPSIEVNKTVLDPETEEWVDEIEANIGDVVRFKCEIHNDGTCPLTDIVARDTLSESLNYADTATVNGEPWEPSWPRGIGPSEDKFWWEFQEWVLLPCQTITIEFDAHVIKCGVDVNMQTVHAVCVETQEEVFDDDTATVIVPPKPGIEVNKTVWDQEREAWVEETTAEISDIVRFRCEIHNNGTCCPLTNFVVTDILSDSLEYADTATVNGEPWEPTIVSPNEFMWEFPEWVLEPCETITIEFDTHVIKCGVDVNTQKVTAVCVETQEEVFDDDTATVIVPPKPGIEVNKTVWDQEREAWVEETTAEISDIVRFRCEIHNNGTCCPLTNFVVTDILSDSLEYADTATVNGEPWEPTIVSPNEFRWEFPEWVLEPCETITIEFDTHVIKCGVDVNTQNVTAVCVETQEEVFDDDTATVIVPPKPGIEVNKTVWDQEREAWVEETTAEISEIVRFRCEIHNNGTCCSLTDLVVSDVLSDSLEYEDNAIVHFPNGTTMPMEPRGNYTFWWEFPDLVLLPCETLTIEFDAHVIKCGVDINIQRGTAVCVETQEEVFDEDTATVVVPPKPGIEVNKTVWDGEAWVEETTAEIGDVVRFRCEMHNNGTCCPLTDFVVTDILSESLKYDDNAIVHFPDGTTVPMEPIIFDSTYVWEFPCLVLVPCETLTIEFDAEVVKCGVDVNTQNVTAVCVETGDQVFDDDTATVIVPPKPGIEVNKTVWDQEREAWVEETTAEISDIVRFRCEIHNNGTCCPLTNFVVTDILSDSLEYADTATVNGEPWEPTIVSPNEFMWVFPEWVLEPCETITIEFDTHVIKCGVDVNTQNVTAVCVETGDQVFDDDTATVIVPPKQGIEVNKTVWNGTAWVEETRAEISEIVRFRCEIHNNGTCGPLTNLVVTDILSESLEYADTATVNGEPWEPTIVSPNEFMWVFPEWVLEHCNTITIEFDTHVIKCGVDVNTQMVTAVCVETGEVVFDDDTATVIVPQKPGIEVNKTVWDQEREAWVDRITANVSDTVRFRCEMHNNGTCCPLTNLVVTDTLSDSLEYADNVTIYLPDDTKDLIEPVIVDGTYVWKFPNLVLLPCQTITIEFDALVIDYGYDCNVQNATAICEEIGVVVYDEDTACVDVPKPDLTVTAINVNADLPGLCGLPFGPKPHAGARTQCNSISAEIEEKNGVATGAFDVCFYVDDDLKCKVPVAGMAGWANKTVWCNCSWYPLAGPHTINVTVDCENVINESDETNNTLLKDVTAVQHGLKGNSWQDGRDITTLQCHEQDNINLTYSVGDSKKAGVGWTEYYSNWTQSDLSIPDGATIEKARLYAYYNWDKTPAGNVTDFFSLSFNGVPIAPAAIYKDSKHPSRLGCPDPACKMCSCNYPYGMLAYDVIGDFNANADNTAVLTNSYPEGKTAMTGMLLVVVYYHPDEPGRIIWINEGFDTLFAGVYYGTDYGVSSEEATTYAPFEDCVPIPMDEVRKATLVTITNHAGDIPGSDKNRLYFNTVLLGDGLWSYMGLTQIGANEADVLDLLDPTDNTAAYQSHIPTGGTSGDWMEASNAFLILEKPKPDLTVTAINVNADLPGLCGLPFGPKPHAGARTQCNSISAEIEEKNGVATGAFDVCFYVDDDLKCEVPVAGMAGWANKTVWCNCSWYPLAGPHTINVTVDCENVIDESDETNNTLLKDVTAVQHGLKGNSWQDGRDITTLQCHEQDNINLTYSVGDSKKVGVGWTKYYSNWTQSDLSIPDGATIEKARLYAYYNWDKTPAGNVTDFFSLSFNGVPIAPAAIYTDSKHPSRLGCPDPACKMCSCNYPYGMLAYDVTGQFNAIADNTAVLTNSYPEGKTAMTGMLLVVVYKHPGEPGRIIWINEGFDTLFAGVYYGTDYGVSSDEATTYAPFEDCVPIPMDEVRKATLVTITNHAGDIPGSDKNRLYFNTVLLGDGLWSYMGLTQIGDNAADVLDLLDPTDNTAAYQSNIPVGGTSGDWMEASNAFLILEKEVPCPAKYAVYQANVRDPEGRLNELRALRDEKLEDGYVTSYYEHSPMLTLVLSRADPDLVKDGAQLVSKYSIPVGLHVQGMDVNERITKQDVEEALSFTDRLKREVMKNRDAIGVKSTEAIIVFIDEFEGQVKASEGKTFSAALKSSIYYEGGQLRVDQQIVKE